MWVRHRWMRSFPFNLFDTGDADTKYILQLKSKKNRDKLSDIEQCVSKYG